MELNEYISILRKRWVSVAIIAFATLAATAAVTLLMTPKYSATNRMFFSVEAGETVSDLAQGSTFTEKQITSYAEVATTPLVLGPVIEDLGLDTSPTDLASTLAVAVPPETMMVDITATDENPERAAEIANAVAKQLSIAVGDLSPERQDGSESVRATVTTPAAAPADPSSPNITRNLALGAVLGLMLGVGVAILREMLDTKVRDEKDISAVTDSSVIGTIGFDSTGVEHPVFMYDDPTGQRAEAMRRLRTNLQFVDLADRPGSIVVTSSVPGEGKTTTAINLAVALADSGARVVLVDADLRRPSIADYMGLEGRVGLTTVLIGRAEIGDVVQPWRDTSLDVLPSGQIPPNPSELLGSRAMATLLGTLTQSYDMVLIDSPPLLPVTDAAVLTKLAGGAVVVAGADRIHKAQLRESLDNLENVGARMLGLVLNKVEQKGRDGYEYTYESYTSGETVADSGARRNGRRMESGSRGATWPGKPLAAQSRRP
ncbi:polysaccharide biosynthesis tyrosine autokinase [Georgenia sp. EYE_87]|uniref:polysaccharide biosynthesis tyrosine autokinase n=1 Tax=Georgenia sp. EYE_87 TaxID=2853448 RepID=UPI00200603D9|nr:polysaccharide biosynthesis tyrosine autokinase [Georgenia sp. EYE_87]MCK6210826.1 polysaccharide biosynthesis tyrosine autokinase [Georgenia sp. EYE_87]